ncbi:hypothetical protein BKA69DRAFT_1049489 [Paraphysoderma sedebokerense]|nr:hypothetical protein BKA69DRAFT_1049489 [Paraphysoderma sedebokerense]
MKYTLAIPILLFISTALIFLVQSLMRPLIRTVLAGEDIYALKVDSTRYKILRILHMLLTVVYTSVTSSSLALFDCSQESDGQYYLDVDPSIRCYTNEWYHDVPYSVAAICVYVIGIPLYFFAIYFFHHQTTRTTPFWTSLQKICGKIVSVERHYKKEYQFFAVIQLFQKLCVVATGMFFTRYGYAEFSIVSKSLLTDDCRYKGLQTILTLTILLGSLLTYVRFKPYAYDLLNRMEMVSIISSTVILGFGLAFLDDLNSAMRSALTVFILAVIFGFSAVIFGASVYEIKTSVRERMNSKKEMNDCPVVGRGNMLTTDRSNAQSARTALFR